MAQFWRAVLGDPLTWLAAVVSVGLAGAVIWWFELGVLGALASLGFGGAVFALWGLVAAVGGRAQERIQAELRGRAASVAAERDQRIAALEVEFQGLDFTAGVEQIRGLRQKFDALSDVITKRLDGGELAYGRYLGMAEQVYLSSIDNLADVAVALRSVSTVDRSELQRRLVIARGRRGGADDAAAIEARVEMHDAQQERIEQLMTRNEEALTTLMRTATELAETRTRQGEARLPAEVAIAELERLAKSSRRYAVRE